MTEIPAGLTGDAVPTEPPRDHAALFATERSRLLELLADLVPGDWERPSPCPGWSVLGLCCHLAGDDLGLLARDRDGHYGTVPPAGATEGEFIGWLDDTQDEWVRAARRLSPRLVVDMLRWTGPQVVDLFRRQDPRARAASVSWAGAEPVPAWLGQARELSEFWIHRQQLLQALGRPSDLREELAGAVLDALRYAYAYRLATADGRLGDTVTIIIDGPVARTWHLIADAGGWRFAERPGRRTVAGLAMSTERAWRLLTNNLSASERPGLAVSGDQALTDRLLRTRAIVGEPQWT